MTAKSDATETAAALIAAINVRDEAALDGLLDADAEVVTGRNVHAGADAFRSWAIKTYDHLHRFYAIDEYRTSPGRVLGLGHIEHHWTAEGGVADSTPIALIVEVGGGSVRRLIVADDAEAALAEFESGAA